MGKRLPKVHVYQDQAGQWRWRYRAANGRVLADSAESYRRRASCYRGAMQVCDLAREPLDMPEAKDMAWMDPDRWRSVEVVLDAARKRPSA